MKRMLDVVWLLGVIAAGLAVVTNIGVMAAINDVNKELVSVNVEVDRLSMKQRELMSLHERQQATIDELQAQVQFGLADRYNIKED